MLVMKFGGTSVDGAANISNAVDLALEGRRSDQDILVVVSAMAGTTDALVGAARGAAAGEKLDPAIVDALAERHKKAAAQLGGQMVGAQRDALGAQCDALGAFIDQTFGTLNSLLQSVSILGELTPRALDRIISLGESLSARLVASGFNARGVAAEAVDANSNLIVTDSVFGEAAPDLSATRAAARHRLEPIISRGAIPVVTGFIASNRAGETTTLGRSGSDYSAAILGAALDADEVWIWSDVNGILTADPKIVPEARVIEHLSYVTAAELASCGAEVLHPKTIRPLVQGKIPLRLKNTFNRSHRGTLISGRFSEHPPAIISTEGLCLLTIRTEKEGWKPDEAAATLRRMARAGVRIVLFVQSAWQQGLSVLIPAADAEAAMMAAAAGNLAANVRPRAAAASVIGPGVIMPAMAALGETGATVLATLQATADAGIIFVVPEDDLAGVVRRLHARLNGGWGKD